MTLSEININDLRILIKEVVDESIENHIEDMMALSSKDYKEAIKRSRNEFNKGEFIELENIDV